MVVFASIARRIDRKMYSLIDIFLPPTFDEGGIIIFSVEGNLHLSLFCSCRFFWSMQINENFYSTLYITKIASLLKKFLVMNLF
jgi:hypothetical protein